MCPRVRAPATCLRRGTAACRPVRWVICTLLFFAATINYVDRQVIGILKPTLQGQFGWSEVDYGDIVFAFQLAYGIGLLIAGGIVDRLGPRKGFAVAIVIWSLAAMAHAGRRVLRRSGGSRPRTGRPLYSASVAGFIVARLALGLGEAGNFPAAIKVVAEWFPKRERAFATGLFNSGTNIGALVTPLVVPLITLRWGWPCGIHCNGRARIRMAGGLVGHLPAAEHHPRCRRPSSRTSAAIPLMSRPGSRGAR